MAGTLLHYSSKLEYNITRGRGRTRPRAISSTDKEPMHINRKSLAACIFLLLSLAGRARADVRVPALIGDNMVLQQGRKVRVWGRAEPGERVTVTFQGDRASATADARGRWEVLTGPHKAGGPFELTVAGRNTLT